MDNTLILFTNFFPFGHQESFIENELPYLAKKFSEIILVPHHFSEHRRPVPKNVSVELSFSRFFSQPKWKQLLPRFWHTRYQLHAIPKTFNFQKIKYYAGYISMAEGYSHLIKNFLTKRPELSTAIFYTYWFFVQTAGIASYKKRYHPNLQLITRAHGYDLYEELSPYKTIPLREQTIKQLTFLLPISDYGKQYLINKYPQSNPSTCRLGVEDPGFTNIGSKKGNFTLLSCSNLVDIKRIPLIISALKILAKQQSNLKITWHHLGDGPEMHAVHSLAKKELGLSISWKFHGKISHEEIYPFYRKYGIDIFIHMSQSEGIPVSIMEAYACGVPAIAASVGGIPEIINNSNGVLLGKNPFPEEIAYALELLANDEAFKRKLKRKAKETWETQFLAERNFSQFFKLLNVGEK